MKTIGIWGKVCAVLLLTVLVAPAASGPIENLIGPVGDDGAGTEQTTSPDITYAWADIISSPLAWPYIADDEALAIGVDETGFYVAGVTSGYLKGYGMPASWEPTVQLDSGFVTKYSLTGELLWTAQYGGYTAVEDGYEEWAEFGANVMFNDIVVCDLGVYVTGCVWGSEGPEYWPVLPGCEYYGGYMDGFIMRLNPEDGNILWMRQIGTTVQDYPMAIAAGADSILIAGTVWEGGGFFPDQALPGGSNWFICSYTPNGDLNWVTLDGTIYNDWLWDMATTENGIYLVGWKHAPDEHTGLIVGYDFDGQYIADYQFSASYWEAIYTIRADDVGHLYVAGDTFGELFGTNSGERDCFLACLDGQLNLLFGFQFGTTGTDSPWSIALDPSGIFIGGEAGGPFVEGQEISGYSDAFINKYDYDGNLIWSYLISSTGWEWTFGLEMMSSGLYFGGQTDGILFDMAYVDGVDSFVGKFNIGPDIDVSPASIDLGSVDVWATVQATVTITNVGGAGLVLNGAALDQYGCPYYVITESFPTFVLPPGESVAIVVEYHPWEAGTHSTCLYISSDDPDEGTIEVPMTATAVASEAPPEEQIEDTGSFIEDAAEDGELAGTGDGASADNRLDAFSEELQGAIDQYEAGDFEGALDTLQALYKKCDGQPAPPDFVTGDAAVELRERILWLIEVIEDEMDG